MQLNALIERLNLLQSQARWPESRVLLETYLADHPDDEIARLYYINTLANMGEKALARQLIGPLLEENADDPTILRLAAIIELNDNKPKVAERYADTSWPLVLPLWQHRPSPPAPWPHPSPTG